MERAVQTGSIIAQTLDVPLFGVPDLHEVGGVFMTKLSKGSAASGLSTG
jgi:hypothetical protein